MNHYIATWFYREDAAEASYYPQAGGKGDSALLHSVYMQIQVPFFTTFARYNADARLLFFTNIDPAQLPPYLLRLFGRLGVQAVRLDYRHRPPEGWYRAWRNQFFLYDILDYMAEKMEADDTLLISDADCICRRTLHPLWDDMRTEGHGAAFYELSTDTSENINGITLTDMTRLYTDCYGTAPRRPLAYCGGEFVAFTGEVVGRICSEYGQLWQHNLCCFAEGRSKLNEEAHFLSLLAERLGVRNNVAGKYVKRLWTTPQYNNVQPGDEQLVVWHMPYEKKRGLYRLYRWLQRHPHFDDDNRFWTMAGRYCGIPRIGLGKRIHDRIHTLWMKMRG